MFRHLRTVLSYSYNLAHVLIACRRMSVLIQNEIQCILAVVVGVEVAEDYLRILAACSCPLLNQIDEFGGILALTKSARDLVPNTLYLDTNLSYEK